MNNDHSALVAKVWNYAHVLRDEGIGYGDYVGAIYQGLLERNAQGDRAFPSASRRKTCSSATS